MLRLPQSSARSPQPAAHGSTTISSMINVNKLIPGARGLAAVLLKRAATVELDWDLRQKSRFEATDSSGRRLGVFLPRGSVVRGGDVLVAEDGSLVRVHAAPQPVLVVRPCPQHGSAFDLSRAAYHLGNRHVALELQADHLKLEPDHVLAEMLRNMHMIVTEENAAFEPESGAYAAGGHEHGHGHGAADVHAHAHEAAHEHGHGREQAHEHAHEHGHTAAHAHAPAPAPAPAAPETQHRHAPGHVHGPGCGHDH